MWWWGGRWLQREDLGFSAVKCGEIRCTALVNPYTHIYHHSTHLQNLTHPEISSSQSTDSTVASTGCSCTQEKLHEWPAGGSGARQAGESMTVTLTRRKLLSAQQTPHGSSLDPRARPGEGHEGREAQAQNTRLLLRRLDHPLAQGPGLAPLPLL